MPARAGVDFGSAGPISSLAKSPGDAALPGRWNNRQASAVGGKEHGMTTSHGRTERVIVIWIFLGLLAGSLLSGFAVIGAWAFG